MMYLFRYIVSLSLFLSSSLNIDDGNQNININSEQRQNIEVISHQSVKTRKFIREMAGKCLKV